MESMELIYTSILLMDAFFSYLAKADPEIFDWLGLTTLLCDVDATIGALRHVHSQLHTGRLVGCRA
jgi:hypothetical protein